MDTKQSKDMILRLVPTAEFKLMRKALIDAKAPIKETKNEGHLVELTDKRGVTLFWAMIHSSRKHYLVRYHKDLFFVQSMQEAV